jgi:hypothetical protein
VSHGLEYMNESIFKLYFYKNFQSQFFNILFTFQIFWLKNYSLIIFAGDLGKYEIPKDWKTMENECVEKVKDQVQEELKASMTYLAMVIKNKT